MKYEFVCNCTPQDVPKIQRLKYDLLFKDPQATPGYTAEQNKQAGLVGVFQHG
jgi:hypothetical protein